MANIDNYKAVREEWHDRFLAMDALYYLTEVIDGEDAITVYEKTEV